MQVLDHGYVNLIESWGSDERIVEAARMSTNKGFLGWGPKIQCEHCGDSEPHSIDGDGCPASGGQCKMGPYGPPGDEKLLNYLYTNHHDTPFEMAGMIIEVKAPIFVFREWHRHRTQSYNEMSARYTPLPNENYAPDLENLLIRCQGAVSNKQAQAVSYVNPAMAANWLENLDKIYATLQDFYECGLDAGIPKELARIILPVGRYSRMRASANLRNWLGFLRLRLPENAQWEIRQYANAVAACIEEKFPRTYALFQEEMST